MIFDWDAFVIRLRTYPSGFHQVLPPCPAGRVQNVEMELGKLPQTLREMLARLNGAQLFCAPNLSVTLFGITPNPPLRGTGKISVYHAPQPYEDAMQFRWLDARVPGGKSCQFIFCLPPPG